MNTQKAAYWLALAVFGLALHSEYRHGSFPALHRAADRASFTLCQLATHAERAVAVAKLLIVRPALGTNDLLAAADARQLREGRAEMLRDQVQSQIELHRNLAQEQAEMLRDQSRARADMVRTLVDLRRAQFEQARSRMASQILVSNTANRRMIVVRPSGCSKTSSRVAIIGSDDRPNRDEDSD